jgi:hypothetical protein
MPGQDTALVIVALAHSFPRTAAEVDETASRFLREVRARWLRLGTKCEEEAAARGVNLREAPLSALLPVLEAARHVDDDGLQRMFARLLVTAVADPRKARPVFLSKLANLGPVDAAVFAEVARAGEDGIGATPTDPRWESLFVLHEEGLVEAPHLPANDGTSLWTFVQGVKTTKAVKVHLTGLGWMLWRIVGGVTRTEASTSEPRAVESSAP